MITPQGRRLAFHKTEGEGPGVVFLGGFMSDMSGTKAVHLEAWARGQGRAFLRFDYSGHGDSSGAFTDGTIGQWAEDAEAVITAQTTGPQILVGSSMGGWIALLLTRDKRVETHGLVTIAGAPDFTEDGFWASFTEAQRAELLDKGVVPVPSDYGDPYPITRALIEDGRNHLLLRSPLDLTVPLRMLQGEADEDVSVSTAVTLFGHISAPDASLILVKGSDHRFSEPGDLARIERAIKAISGPS